MKFEKLIVCGNPLFSTRELCEIIVNSLVPKQFLILYQREKSKGVSSRLIIPLIGCKFNNLKIIQQTFGNLLGVSLVTCVCDCGNIKTLPVGDVKSGNTKSCGCRKENTPKGIVDRSGERVGYLVVLHDSGKRTAKKDKKGNIKQGNVIWVCQCDCGKIVEVRSCHLKGHTSSCGHCYKKSKLHLKTREVLIGLGFPFEEEHILPRNVLSTYDNHRSFLRIDFLITISNRLVALECQGRQHYKCVDYWGGEEHYRLQQERDTAKKQILHMCNIPLIEVDYRCPNIRLFLQENFKEKGFL